MFGTLLETLRRKRPLIHSITNPVTINDCANILLACGASPIMADAVEEVAEITARCQGLVLNLGTLHKERIPAMLAAGQQANTLGLPVVLDPVGVGASAFRAQAAQALLAQLRFAVIRGNVSEIGALVGAGDAARGVDAADAAPGRTADTALAHANALACRTGAVVVATGTEDFVTDGKRGYCIRNGHPMMRSVTGTGCQLSCLTAAFVAANPAEPLAAAAAAVCAMGLCGEIAHGRLAPGEGNASYRTRILDAVYWLTPEQLEEGARYEIR